MKLRRVRKINSPNHQNGPGPRLPRLPGSPAARAKEIDDGEIIDYPGSYLQISPLVQGDFFSFREISSQVPTPGKETVCLGGLSFWSPFLVGETWGPGGGGPGSWGSSRGGDTSSVRGYEREFGILTAHRA